MDECPGEFINYKAVIYFNGGQMLCKSYGSTKEHAKRNVCLLGYAKLKELIESGQAQNENQDGIQQDDMDVMQEDEGFSDEDAEMDDDEDSD